MGNTSTRTGCWHLEVDVEGKGEKVTTILYFGRKANYPLCHKLCPVNPATPPVCLKENSKPGALVRCWPGIKTNLSSKLLDSKNQGWDFSPLCQCCKKVRGGPGAVPSPLSRWYDGNVGNNWQLFFQKEMMAWPWGRNRTTFKSSKERFSEVTYCILHQSLSKSCHVRLLSETGQPGRRIQTRMIFKEWLSHISMHSYRRLD